MNIVKYLDKLPSLEGKTIIITGANSGIGLQACFHLAYKKANIIMACRNLQKALLAKKQILSVYKDANIQIIEYDQSSFTKIEKFVLEVNKLVPHIDALVCNAGVYYPKKNYRTVDDFELTFGTNYIGVYYLLSLLNRRLDNDHSRVICIGSVAALSAKKKCLLKDNEKLSRDQIYGYSKYCLCRLVNELAKQNSNITYRIVHPGITSTNIISSEQTGLPSWYSKLGHQALTLFTHSSKKASLVILKGINSDNEEKPYIGPRGIFSISGFPKEKKYPRYVKKTIIKETIEFIESRVK